MIARKGQFDGAERTRPTETLRSALAGTSPSRPGNGAAARSTMTPLALIQGFLKRSHSAQRRQIIPFASLGAITLKKVNNKFEALISANGSNLREKQRRETFRSLVCRLSESWPRTAATVAAPKPLRNGLRQRFLTLLVESYIGTVTDWIPPSSFDPLTGLT